MSIRRLMLRKMLVVARSQPRRAVVLFRLRSAPKPQEPVNIEAAIEHLTGLLAEFASNLDGDDYGIRVG